MYAKFSWFHFGTSSKRREFRASLTDEKLKTQRDIVMAKRKKLLTKKDEKAIGTIIKAVFAIIYYPLLWICKGIVWLLLFIWELLKTLFAKLMEKSSSTAESNDKRNESSTTE